MSEDVKMITCEEFEERASEYLDGEVGATWQHLSSEHLLECSTCSELLRELRATVKVLGCLAEQGPKARLEEIGVSQFKEYFPEPEPPSKEPDWTRIKVLWTELSQLAPEDRFDHIDQEQTYHDPLLCEWLVTRARRVAGCEPSRAQHLASLGLSISGYLAQEPSNIKWAVLALNCLAFAYRFRGAVERALAETEVAGDLIERFDLDEELKADVYSTKGVLLAEAGRAAEGETLLREALRIRRRGGSPRLLSSALVNLAVVKCVQGNNCAAIELYRKARQVISAVEDNSRLELHISCSLAVLSCEEGRVEEAEEILPTVERLAGRYAGWRMRLQAFWLRGSIARAKGDWQTAKRVFKRVKEICAKKADFRWYVEASLDLGRVYLAQERWGRLMNLLSQLDSEVRAHGAAPELRLVLRQLRRAALARTVSAEMLGVAVARLRRGEFAAGR